MNAQVSVETVQSTGPRFALQLHGSSPEPPLRIALAVVEPIVGKIAFGIGDGRDFDVSGDFFAVSGCLSRCNKLKYMCVRGRIGIYRN